jgi:hypothetical protein
MARASVIRTYRGFWLVAGSFVAMLVIDVHGKWTAGSAGPLASGARFSSRHCKGAPATPFPPLQMISITTSPINRFAPVEYWQK